MTTAYEVLQGITQVDPSQLEGVEGTVILFDLTGPGGGKWTLRTEGGEIKLEEGATASPSVTLSMPAQDLVAISTGELNPVAAFMQGRVKVSGDMALAMRLQNILT